MYDASVLLLVLMAVCAIPRHAQGRYMTLHFRQPVDHFSYTTSDSFLQRYLVDKTFYKAGGPVFFYTGNEGDIVWFYNNTGAMLEWAADFSALVVFAEHRYYGESLPYGPDSFKGLNHVGYLTSEQALADFASLIDFIKQSWQGASSSPVVAFGGSYGGMLAAWLRMKYPHSVIGSIAASAPILMFGDLVPCERFSQIVTHDFDVSGENCVMNIRKSWKVITKLGATDEGRATLTHQLRLCDSLKSDDHVTKLKDWLSETYSYLAMVDYPYAASFLEPLPAWPIKVVCRHLVNASLTDAELIEHLRDAVGVYYNYTGNSPCLNTSQDAVSSLEDRGWSFQSCTEMVMPMCNDGVNDMFEIRPWNLTRFTDDCLQKWSVTPRPHWIIQEYGGRNISAHSNIIFSNGDLDPWSAGGVLEPPPASSLYTIRIKDGAHHLDLRASHPDDTPAVRAARSKEKSIVSAWIEQFHGQVAAPPLVDDAGGLQVVCMSPHISNCVDDLPVDTSPLPPASLTEELVVFGIVAIIFIGVLIFVGFRGRHKKLTDDDNDPFSVSLI